MINTRIKSLFILLMLMSNILILQSNVQAQNENGPDSIPSLPDKQGWAGMFAGTSHGKLICLGGTNFPDKYPWEGGKKRFYDHIYVLNKTKWEKQDVKMDFPCAYGISVSYRDIVITVGGQNEEACTSKVTGYVWRNERIEKINYPDLPVELANMTGAILKDILIVAGGNGNNGKPSSKVYLLDLAAILREWKETECLPGPGRILASSSIFNDQFYLFSGMRTDTSAGNQEYSCVLNDAYRLTVSRKNTTIESKWEKLAPMPRGIAGIGTPIPILRNGKMMFWGGVDAVTNLHTDPSTFPGILNDVLLYDGTTDIWESGGRINNSPARVTLPVVHWRGHWIYISGEVKPGIRTNSIFSINDQWYDK